MHIFFVVPPTILHQRFSECWGSRDDRTSGQLVWSLSHLLVATNHSKVEMMPPLEIASIALITGEILHEIFKEFRKYCMKFNQVSAILTVQAEDFTIEPILFNFQETLRLKVEYFKWFYLYFSKSPNSFSVSSTFQLFEFILSHFIRILWLSTIFRCLHSLPDNTDSMFEAFIRCAFEEKVEMRLSAEQCLNLPFFKKYIIPNTLPVESLTEAPLFIDQQKKRWCFLDGKFNDHWKSPRSLKFYVPKFRWLQWEGAVSRYWCCCRTNSLQFIRTCESSWCIERGFPAIQCYLCL